MSGGAAPAPSQRRVEVGEVSLNVTEAGMGESCRRLIIWGEGDAYPSPLILERSARKMQGPLRLERLVPFLEEQRDR